MTIANTGAQTIVGHRTPAPRALWPFGSTLTALRLSDLVAVLVMSLAASGDAPRADRPLRCRAPPVLMPCILAFTISAFAGAMNEVEQS